MHRSPHHKIQMDDEAMFSGCLGHRLVKLCWSSTAPSHLLRLLMQDQILDYSNTASSVCASHEPASCHLDLSRFDKYSLFRSMHS